MSLTDILTMRAERKTPKWDLTANPLSEQGINSAVRAAQPLTDEAQLQVIGDRSKLQRVEAPPSWRNRVTGESYFAQIYNTASYYFYNSGIFATGVKRLIEETLRRGIEWTPRFQTRCPRCQLEFERNVTTCTNCGYKGQFQHPDPVQRKLLVNFEGTPLIDKCNKYGWTLKQLCNSLLQQVLVYNQPILLDQCVYIIDHNGNIREEIPGEFITIDPTCARMLYDDNGEPGNGEGFAIEDRHVSVPMPTYGGVDDLGRRLYKATWCIGANMFGSSQTDPVTYYGPNEIWHTTYGVISPNYGIPLITFVATEIQALIAITSREAKYFSVGHPTGILTISAINQDNMATFKREVNSIMSDDPYATPIVGIPHVAGQTTPGEVEWVPFGTSPTRDLVEVKRELIERFAAFFDVPAMLMGDSNSYSRRSNEQYQLEALDRSLQGLRELCDNALDWIVSKYTAITDWTLRVVEPPDASTIDEETNFAKKLANAKNLNEMGFKPVSQGNGEIEMSATPAQYDPIEAMTRNILNPSSKIGGQDTDRLPSKTKPPQGGLDTFVKGESDPALYKAETDRTEQ